MTPITEEELKRRLNHEDNLINKGKASTDSVSGDSASIDSAVDKSGGDEVKSSPFSFSDVEYLIDDVVKESKPRKPHVRLSEEQKVVAGTLAHLDGQKAVAELFGPTQPAISMAARGLNGGTALAQQKDNPSRREKIKDNLESIVELSSNVVVRSLTRISDRKLDDLNATGLATVASKVASVIDKINAKSATGLGSQVVIVAFDQKRIDDYNTIDVPVVVQ